jgi:TolB-like protein/tetratricopeptide (TPR) repeat protein
MRRCETCNRNYLDDTLNFCLEDGMPLVSAGLRDAPTEVLHYSIPPEFATRLFTSGTFVDQSTANAIAVLPFVNMSSDREIEYFSDGLAEELLNVLSRIRGLRVAARTSAFSFKGKQATIGEIGAALNVASVLEGSLRMAGDHLRISVQLVNVADGFHLWAETYDRTMDDIFAIQDDIAESVVEQVRIRIFGEIADDEKKQVEEEVAVAVRGRADDPEAQRLMMLGRHFLDRTTRDETEKAIGYFRQAIEIDETYALCWAELGRAALVQAGKAWISIDEGLELARSAVDRALSIEPDLAEAHALLGRMLSTYEWNFTEAEAAYKRAMELAPDSSSVLDGASVLAYKTGKLNEAIELSRRVLLHDPLSAAFWHNFGLTCHAAGRLDESIKSFSRALELSPQRSVSDALLALVLLDMDRGDEALVQAEKGPDEFWRLWSLAIIHAVRGENDKADEALDTIKREHAEGSAFQIAEIYAARGDADQAFTWLERAMEERDPGVTHTKVNPRFRALHNDPRWSELLRRIGF